MPISVISPRYHGRPLVAVTSEEPIPELGVSPVELEQRARANTFEWLPRQFDEEAGAFHGHYWADEQRFDVPQTVNLIAPWQLLAAYDRYGDEDLLTMARRAAEWVYRHFVVSHPMEVTIGGVRDSQRSEELWTKYSAEHIILNLGLYRRTSDPSYMQRALESAEFLIQAARHGYASRYDERERAWESGGWRSFGRVIEAFLELEQVTGESVWLERAQRWGEYALSNLQGREGGFYLIDDDYFNSDLAADELRGLLFLAEETKDGAFMDSARRFADWLLMVQREDGSWPLSIDRNGNIVVATAGPGDSPNLGVALLHFYEVTGETKYSQAAMRAFRYGLSMQILPGSGQPYEDDPRMRWGFWSWDPRYDYSTSADQSTHHVRGMLFLLDTLSDAKKRPPSVMEV